MNEIAHDRPLWHRILDFPLVAMIVATALYILATALALFLGKFVSIGQPATSIAHAAITLALTLAVYKLVIAHLGERPRDDLPAIGALPDLGKGIAVGAILFSTVVGVAALFGVYRVTGSGTASDLVLPLVATAIMPDFMEELLFRRILFR